MKIHFKEVGQGDSIILQWDALPNQKIGIIDCNLKEDRANPVLNFLSTAVGLSEIEFIILSHPHTDHFSGLNQIIDYCHSKNIIIKLFIHTSSQIREFFNAAVKGAQAKAELEKLFTNIQTKFKSGLIKDVFIANNNSREIKLDDKWNLKFLAPTYDEVSSFIRSKYKPDLVPKVNSSAANLLSTFIKLYSKESHILFTSDSVKSIFQREVDNKFKNLNSSYLRLGQIPHHGAKDNFHNYFWKKQFSKPSTVAAISVGDNTYGHPSIMVLDNLKTYGYSTQLTTTRLNNGGHTVSSVLNLVSRRLSTSAISVKQDLIFDTDLL